MKAGEIALAQLQQADGRIKTRPVLVLTQMPPFPDHLVCALSSKLQHECVDFDEVIAAGDDDFSDSEPIWPQSFGRKPLRYLCYLL